jgi:hypothetical protein
MATTHEPTSPINESDLESGMDVTGTEDGVTSTQGNPLEEMQVDQTPAIETNLQPGTKKKRVSTGTKIGVAAVGLIAATSSTLFALRGSGSSEPVKPTSPAAEAQAPTQSPPEVQHNPAIVIGNINTALVKPGEQFYTDTRPNGDSIKVPMLRSDSNVNEYMSAFLANMAWSLTMDTPKSMQAFSATPNFAPMIDKNHSALWEVRSQADHKEDLQVLFFDTQDNKATFTKYGDKKDTNSPAATDTKGRESIELTNGTLYMKTWTSPDGHSKWQEPQDPKSAYTYRVDKMVVYLDPVTMKYSGIDWHSTTIDQFNR